MLYLYNFPIGLVLDIVFLTALGGRGVGRGERGGGAIQSAIAVGFPWKEHCLESGPPDVHGNSDKCYGASEGSGYCIFHGLEPNMSVMYIECETRQGL